MNTDDNTNNANKCEWGKIKNHGLRGWTRMIILINADKCEWGKNKNHGLRGWTRMIILINADGDMSRRR
jgi:hypothetical protein